MRRPTIRTLTSKAGVIGTISFIVLFIRVGRGANGVVWDAEADADAAPAPWWHVTVSTAPASVARGAAHDEVQEVTVDATGGEFILDMEGHLIGILPYNATHEALQRVLEHVYGAENVEVTGGPTKEEVEKAEPWSYVVTSIGALADQPVQAITADEESFFKIELTCGGVPCPTHVHVTKVTAGRPDGTLLV